MACDDRTEKGDPPAELVKTPLADHLFLVLDGGQASAGGMRSELTGVCEITFGRGEGRIINRAGQQLVVKIPDRRMSTSHARILRTATGFRLEDTDSTNGTWLDGERVRTATLEDGAVIELGRTFFVVRERLPTPKQTARDVESPSVSSAAQPQLRAASLIPSICAQLEVIAKLAPSQVSILLLGETGTGKEVLSREIHAASKRAGPLRAINCGAIPKDLVASTLFGHKRGAFSGAKEDASGLFRSADGGTLLLDEIGDLPRDQQVVLLRVLQEREVLAVGSTHPIAVDVRVIAATHASLAKLVATGEFRADLLHRLAGHSHTLPPLRERREDLGLLIGGIARELPGGSDMQLTASVSRALLRYDWPGNVRELTQVLSRAVALAGPVALELEHLPAAIAALALGGDDDERDAPSAALSDEDLELLRRLEHALLAHRGNVTRVAEQLGKKRMQIQRWMKRFGLDPARFREP